MLYETSALTLYEGLVNGVASLRQGNIGLIDGNTGTHFPATIVNTKDIRVTIIRSVLY